MSTVVTMPQQGLTEESSVIAEWYVKEGDAVSVGTPLFAIETGKATFDVEAEAAGTVLAVFAAEGDDVPIKAPVCVIGEPGETFERPQTSAPAAAVPAETEKKAEVSRTTQQPATVKPQDGNVFASPRAKTAAERAGVDWHQAVPTGAEGRIMERDVAALAANRGKVAAEPEEKAVGDETEFEIIKNSGRRTFHAPVSLSSSAPRRNASRPS